LLLALDSPLMHFSCRRETLIISPYFVIPACLESFFRRIADKPQ
jgi:hypothetical protein